MEVFPMGNIGYKKLGALVTALLLLADCASIVQQSTQRVRIGSNPPGAEAVIDDRQRVTTPATVELTRRDDHMIVFHKPGYRDESVSLTSGVSGLTLGNVLLGGVIGSNIDASTGAGRVLSSDNIEVTLVPVSNPPAADGSQGP